MTTAMRLTLSVVTISIAEATRRYGLTRNYIHALIEAGWGDKQSCLGTVKATKTGTVWHVSVVDLDRWAEWYDAHLLRGALAHMERRGTDWIQLQLYRLERDKASFDRLTAKGHFRYESIRCVDSGINHDTYFRAESHSSDGASCNALSTCGPSRR